MNKNKQIRKDYRIVNQGIDNTIKSFTKTIQYYVYRLTQNYKWFILLTFLFCSFLIWYKKEIFLDNIVNLITLMGTVVTLAAFIITFSEIYKRKLTQTIDFISLKKIYEICDGDLYIMSILINDHLKQYNIALLFKKLNDILDNKFKALTYNDWKFLYPFLSLDKVNHRLVLSSKIDMAQIKKLQKLIPLEQVNCVYYIPYNPIYDELMYEYLKNKISMEPDYSVPGLFHETIGKLYIKTGNWIRAEENLIKYLETSKNSKDIRSICNANIQLALLYQHKGEYNKEIEYCNNVLKNSECEPVIIIDTFILLGDNYRMKGEYTSAFKYFNDAESLINNYPAYPFSLQKARISLSKGFMYDHMGNDDVEKELKKSFDLFRKVNDIQGQGAVYIYCGIHKLDKQDLTSAEKMFEEALIISRNSNNKKLENFALNHQAKLKQLQGRTEDAYNLCIESLNIEIEVGTKYGIAVTLMTLAPIIHSLPNYFDKSQLIPILNFISTFYSKLLPESEKKQLQELKKIDNSIDLPIILSNCAIEIFKQLGSKYSLSEAFIVKAKIHTKRGEFKLARKIFLEVQKKYSFPYSYHKIDTQIEFLLKHFISL